MSDPNFSAIRARLRYETIDEFVDAYGRYISRGGMFVPMDSNKLKPVGTTVRFQFQLADGTSAMLGEGVVRQLKGLEDPTGKGPVGMLVKFSKLSSETKELVDQIVARKSGAREMPKAPAVQEAPTRESTPAPSSPAAAESAPSEQQPAPQPQQFQGAESSEAEASTGVLSADASDALRTETGGGQTPQEPSQPQQKPQFEETKTPISEASLESQDAASGDEIFDASDDDPTEAVADALGEPSEPERSEPDPFDAPTPVPTEAPDDTPRQVDGDVPTDDTTPEPTPDDDPFGAIADHVSEPAEQSSVDEPIGENAADSSGDFWGEQDASGDIATSKLDDDTPVSDAETPSTDSQEDATVETKLDEVDLGQESQSDLSSTSDSADTGSSEGDAPAEQRSEGESKEAITETEGGLKVMAFDDDEVDETAAEEFQQFASGGEEDEIDAMFDDVFGGGTDAGDDGGMFGGGGDGDAEAGGGMFGGGTDAGDDGGMFGGGADAGDDDDVFGAGDEASEDGDLFGNEQDQKAEDFGTAVGESDELSNVDNNAEVSGTDGIDAGVSSPDESTPSHQQPPPPSEPSFGGAEESGEAEFDVSSASTDELGEESSVMGLEVDSEQVVETRDEGSDDAIEADDSSDQGLFEDPGAPPKAAPAPPDIQQDAGADESISDVAVADSGGDSSERIRSLLAMEEDEPSDMSLNLSGGSLDEESSSDNEEVTDDSMESLLASAKQEIESKKEKDEDDEEDDRDILDDLIDDDELPSPSASASTFDVPQPESKKKKKGFISKFFGGDDD